MRMTLYYMAHTVKNQIRKLFRTWVVVFLAVCLLMGVVFGLGAVALSALFEDDEAEDTAYEEVLPEGTEDTAEDIASSPEEVAALLELGVGALVLAVLCIVS